MRRSITAKRGAAAAVIAALALAASACGSSKSSSGGTGRVRASVLLRPGPGVRDRHLVGHLGRHQRGAELPAADRGPSRPSTRRSRSTTSTSRSPTPRTSSRPRPSPATAPRTSCAPTSAGPPPSRSWATSSRWTAPRPRPTTATTWPARTRPDHYNGHIYGVPQVTDTLALLYNKDLFTQAGITSAPKTWADLKADGLAIKAKTGKDGAS